MEIQEQTCIDKFLVSVIDFGQVSICWPAFRLFDYRNNQIVVFIFRRSYGKSSPYINHYALGLTPLLINFLIYSGWLYTTNFCDQQIEIYIQQIEIYVQHFKIFV